MTPFKLTILGCSSAVPTVKRKPTAQLLNVAERFFLIDCGEGTQVRLRESKLKIQRIEHIFISHLHGDHYFGLIGLLSTMHLLGREKEVHVYAHPDLKEIIELQLKASQTNLKFPLFFHFLRYDKSVVLYEDESLTVESIILNHSIPCCGFVFREKQKSRRMVKAKIEEYQIPASSIEAIKEGGDYSLPNGELISHWELTRPAPKPRSYAFCSDTTYDESIIPQIKKVNLLYHEATFLDELSDRAKETYHSTAKEAATIAAKAEVRQLIIGHYSQRYKNAIPLLEEAKSIFSRTLLGEEGAVYEPKTNEVNS